VRKGADRIREIILGDKTRRGESDALTAFFGRKFNELVNHGKSLQEIGAPAGLVEQVVASWRQIADSQLVADFAPPAALFTVSIVS